MFKKSICLAFTFLVALTAAPGLGADLLAPGDFIIAIDADGGSASPAGEQVYEAIDLIYGGANQKYLNSGGANSGFIVTPTAGQSIVTSFEIWTANDTEGRDPTTWELYGTNDPIASTDHSTGTGETWTPIASGPITLPADRNSSDNGPSGFRASVSFANTVPYLSYKMLFPTLKDAGSTMMQIAEVQFYGDALAPHNPVPGDGEMASPWVDAAGVYVMLDYSTGPAPVSITGYFSDNFDDVKNRVTAASLGAPPFPAGSTTAFYVGYDDAAIPAHARVPLVRGKTYYWAVDITYASQTIEGQVWSFKVKPEKAYDPVPVDGATLVAIDPNLDVSWQMGDVDLDGNNVRFEVFYGTDAGAVAIATVPDRTVLATSANIGPLARGTSYTWRVDTVLTMTQPPFLVRTIPGNLWEFETLQDIPITDPNLEGWWRLDAGFGTIAVDWSGNERHGTLMGDPQWVAGYHGNALDFDGSGDYVNIDGYKGVLADAAEVQHEFTVANWFKTTGNAEMVTWGTNSGRQRLSWRIDGGRLRTEHGSGNLRGNTYVNDGEWHHGALVVNRGAALRVPQTLIYVDGREDTTFSGSDNTYNLTGTTDVSIGRRATSDDRYFTGAIDDVRIYDKVLSAAEVGHIMDTSKAWDLNPSDGDIDVPLGTKITWQAGIDPGTGSAFTTHHLYFSENFDDVNDESISPIVVNSLPLEHAPTLAYYGVYYYKINEVGSVNVEGDVQMFKAMYDPLNVTDPNLKLHFKFEDNVLDSSGYGRDGIETGGATYVAGIDGKAIDLYGDDDYVRTAYPIGVSGGDPRTISGWGKADTTAIGNWTNLFGFTGPSGGGGHFDVEIVGGTDSTTAGWIGLHMYNDEWDIIPNDTEWHHLAATFDGTNLALYADGGLVNTVVPSVTLNTPDNVHVGKRYDNTNYFPGLIDDVRVYDYAKSAPEIVEIMRIDLSWAWNPNPGHEATGVPRDQVLSWTHGDGATQSTIYLGKDDPLNMVEVAGPQAANSYDPSPLDLDTDYYWQIAEDSEAPGRVWKFTTPDYVTVDDMEIYTAWDVADNNIFEVWRDGEGNCSPGNGNETGSTVTENADPATVLSGLQSMKYDFDNDGMVWSVCNSQDESRPHLYSKIEAQVAGLASGVGADWTAGGVEALVINFMGQTGNSTTEPLWVQLQDSSKTYGDKVFYGDYEDEDIADMNDPSWHQWNIDLDDFNVDLTNVVSIVIGIGNEGATDPGGSGTLYFDEIRLYIPRCLPGRAKPVGDFDDSCKVDYPDVAALFDSWLLQNLPEDVWAAKAAWADSDVGDVNKPGSFTDLGGGQYTITAGGADIWGANDAFHYAYKPLSGDGQMTVRVTNIAGPSTNTWRKAGIMIRETLDPNSSHAFICVTPGGGGGSSLQWRSILDGDNNNQSGPAGVTMPQCIRLLRMGDEITAFRHADGEWVRHGNPVIVPMPQDVLIGLAVTSHDYSNETTVNFDRVCSDDFVPMDLIGDDVVNFLDYADLLNAWLEEILWPE